MFIFFTRRKKTNQKKGRPHQAALRATLSPSVFAAGRKLAPAMWRGLKQFGPFSRKNRFRSAHDDGEKSEGLTPIDERWINGAPYNQ
jgi:hypothetical protein